VLAECRADLARDGFRTNDANVLDPLAHRIASDAQIRVTFIATDRTVLGESDEDQRTMENHATRPEVVPALARRPGDSVRHSNTVRSGLTEFVVP
jgi:hypothetical protein